MPYISENGQTRFVSQAEYVAWNKGQGQPTSPLRGGTANGNYNPPAGGTELNVSRPVDSANLTNRQRRDLVLQQEKQVDQELATVDAKLAQASTGQITLSPSEVSALEQRKSDLADASNQLADGQPVTSGTLEGGRTTEQIIEPNTTVNTPSASLPQTFERSSESTDVVADTDPQLANSQTELAVPAADIAEQADPTFSPYGEENDLAVPIDDIQTDPGPAPDFGYAQTDPGDAAIPLSDIQTDPGDGALAGYYDAGGIEDFVPGPGGITPDSGNQAEVSSQVFQTKNQETNRSLAQFPVNTDWRVTLRLAPGATYLYNAPQAGLLQPLKTTNGVVFPYTPQISTAYKANYSSYDLTHSNYRGYFYQNSYTDAINLTATFTAQSTADASYVLAVIHFFRSVTKMFYGQDAQRGSPPPLVYLSGLGDYQFNNHPCLVSQFNYTLPADVDYVSSGSPNNLGLNLQPLQNLYSTTLNAISPTVTRLATAFLPKGAQNEVSAPLQALLNNPTYVPSKIDITISLLPVQSRSQVSKQFSLKNFANGNLLKGGFW